MTRITKRDLDGLCDTIKDTLGDDSYSVEYGYGKPRLYRQNGSREVSPRLPSGELYQWMWAYLEGIRDADRCYRLRETL